MLQRTSPSEMSQEANILYYTKIGNFHAFNFHLYLYNKNKNKNMFIEEKCTKNYET